jgi:hypothetical protein
MGQLRGTIRSAQQRSRQRREDIAEAVTHQLRFADVELRCLEFGVTCALHDLQRVVAADGQPRQARRSQVVPAERLARHVFGVGMQLRPVDVCALEEHTKLEGTPGELRWVSNDATFPARLVMQSAE